MQKDPILFNGRSLETNLYRYAANDPINKLDPNGLDWIYSQTTGEIYQVNDYGDRIPGTGGSGFSGQPGFQNDPSTESFKNLGTIPVGTYDIGAAKRSGRTGPVAIPLQPRAGTVTYGRDNFQIHGDSIRSPGTGSTGCIIQGRDVREQIRDSGDYTLRVIR